MSHSLIEVCREMLAVLTDLGHQDLACCISARAAIEREQSGDPVTLAGLELEARLGASTGYACFILPFGDGNREAQFCSNVPLENVVNAVGQVLAQMKQRLDVEKARERAELN